MSMNIEEILNAMEEAEYSQKYICVTCKSENSYIGKVMAFCKRCDNDNGKAGICFNTYDDYTMYIEEDEVKNIVEADENTMAALTDIKCGNSYNFTLVSGFTSENIYNALLYPILKQIRDMKYEHLSIGLEQRTDGLQFIQTARHDEDYRVEVALFSEDGKYHIFVKKSIELEEADKYFRQVCIDYKCPDFEKWDDLTDTILSADAISKIELKHKLPKLYDNFKLSIAESRYIPHTIIDKDCILEKLKNLVHTDYECAVMTENDDYIFCTIEDLDLSALPPEITLDIKGKGTQTMSLDNIRVLILSENDY